MASDEVPPQTRDFLYQHVHTHEELEVLVLLHRQAAERWDEQSIAESLKITVSLVRDALKALTDRGIVRVASGESLQQFVTSADCKGELDQLIALYEQHRLEIVMLLSANAIDRVRTGALRTFADCFFVGKSRKDG